MSQDNKKSFVMYQGDGSNNVFSVPMTKGKYGTISVAFVRRGLDQYEYNPDTWGLNGGLFAWDLSGTKVYTDTATPAIGATIYDQYGVDTGDTVTAVGGATITVNTNVYTRDTLHDVDENTVLTWTGDTLQVGDYIVIERTTTRTQPFEFPNNQKHIEKSDDNLERQIQEVADKVDNALLVDPTHTIDSNKMNPVEWMKTILRSVDKSVRGFRYLNGWLDYSLDDPNIADVDKTWTHLVNTDNIKAIREQSRIEDGETIYWTEYLAQDGTWKILSRGDMIKLSDLADVDFTNLSAGNFIMFDGLKWKNVYSSATASWGTLLGDITTQSDLMDKFAEYVRTDGTSVMTAPLLMRATESFKCAIAPYWDGIGFFKLNDNNSVTLMASIEYNSGFEPATTNAYNIGASARKWKNLYLSGKAYVSVINNGYDITVPTTTGTMALLSDIAFTSEDVKIEDPQDGEFLMYNDGKWTNSKQGYANTYLSNLTATGQAKFDAKANTDMDNLTDTGKNIANWSNNVTNCITEIPQDIKLELNHGTLTLKAGSKLYKADGTYITTTQDYTTTATYADGIAFYDIDNNILAWRQKSECYSQASAPTATQYMLWLDTINNVVKETADYGTTWSTCTLPVGIFTADSTQITSIDRVFNDIGRIGQSAFSLPGIKGLIPNGRNADGTLKNTEFTTTNVYVNTTFSQGLVVNNQIVAINSTGILWQNWIGEYDHEPAVVQYAAYYNSTTNKMYFAYSATEWTELDRAVAGFFSTTTDGVITSFKPKTVFHAVDYNDIDCVVASQLPTAANNYNWYRKYKSGWVEQGGLFFTFGTTYQQYNLPVAMADSNYTILATYYDGDTSAQYTHAINTTQKTTASFKAKSDVAVSFYWYVCGMAA